MVFPDLQNHNFWNDKPRNGSYNFAEHSHAIRFDQLRKLKPSAIAKAGETLTASWANSAGWQTLYHGLRHVGFELDLVLKNSTRVRILEVKTLRHTDFVPDLEVICGFMNPRKTRALKRGANFLLSALAQHKICVEEISCELVVVNLQPYGKVKAYRWPDACSLNS
jgi:Holliday junction resolvase-like predicted endonuclease